MTDKPSWEELNAYVDGELAAVEAARVARAVADDAELAETVARLTRLKAVVQNDILEMPDIRLSTRSNSRWYGVAAASLAAVAAVALLAVFALRTGELDKGFERARAAHQSWAETRSENSLLSVSPAAYLAASQALGSGMYVPDLSAARLKVGRVARMAARGDSPVAVHVGYAGTRGCRISLWIAPAPRGMQQTPAPRGDQSDKAFSWRVGDLGYTMIASRMDDERFLLIVQAAFNATKTFSPPETEMRMALRRNRNASAPCKG